jgi:Txe/YoeB family toxin of Txe-Axe toxin-antitoxin module
MPDRKGRARTTMPPAVRIRPSSDDAHEIVYFQRHKRDDAGQAIPGREFLQRCPRSVATKFQAILTQVAAAPPKRFSGGGYWEAMKGEMTGYFEARADGPQRHHYRLFCRLDYEATNSTKPLLVLLAGMDKPFLAEFSPAQYATVRALGNEYLSRNPRSIA